MEKVIVILNIVGYISSVILIVGIAVGAWLWFKGVLPAMFRLGSGLAKRRIAIFAKGDNLSSAKSLLADSGLFDEKNMLEITKLDDIGRAETASLFLLYWTDWQEDYNLVLKKKTDRCALVIYAPHGSIPKETFTEFDTKRNTSVTNFRGRLLNDIVTTMITTPS